MSGLAAKITFLKQLEGELVSVKDISARRKILYCVDNKLELVERNVL